VLLDGWTNGATFILDEEVAPGYTSDAKDNENTRVIQAQTPPDLA
jgi:hypothetical protein